MGIATQIRNNIALDIFPPPIETLNVGRRQKYKTLQAAFNAIAALTDHFTYTQLPGATVTVAQDARSATVAGYDLLVDGVTTLIQQEQMGFFAFGANQKLYPCEIVDGATLRLVMPYIEATVTDGTLYHCTPNIRRIVLHGNVDVGSGAGSDDAVLSPDGTLTSQATAYAVDIVGAPGSTYRGDIKYSCRSGLIRFIGLRNATGGVFAIFTPTQAQSADDHASTWVVLDSLGVERVKTGDMIGLQQGCAIAQLFGSHLSGSFDVFMPHCCGGRVEIINSCLESTPSYDSEGVSNQVYALLFKLGGGTFYQANSPMRVAGWGGGGTTCFNLEAITDALTIPSGIRFTIVDSPCYVDFRDGATPVATLTAVGLSANASSLELINSPVIFDPRITKSTAWRALGTSQPGVNAASDVRLINSPLGQLRTTYTYANIVQMEGGMGELSLTNAASISAREMMPLQSTKKKLTLTQNTTFPNPSADYCPVGTEVEFIFVQDGTGGRTITFGAKWLTGTVTNGSAATAGQSTYFKFIWNGTNYVQVSPDNTWK